MSESVGFLRFDFDIQRADQHTGVNTGGDDVLDVGEQR